MNKFVKAAAIFAVAAAAVGTMAGCTNAPEAERALKAQNLEPVKVGGYAFFSCSEDDTFKTKFTAKNAKGETVTGAVCSGVLKGSTIRYD